MEVTSSLFNSLFSLSLILIFCFVLYLVIKRAVKNGILEAHDERMEKQNKTYGIQKTAPEH